METNQFIKATVGVVVVYLVIIAVAIPIIGGFTESSPGETGTNSAGLYYGAELNEGTTISVQTTGTVTINDTVVSLNNVSVFTLANSDFYLTCTDNNSRISLDPSQDSAATYAGGISLTYGDGKITGTYVENTAEQETVDVDVPLNGPLFIVITGQDPTQFSFGGERFAMMMSSSGPSIYVNPDTTIYAFRSGGSSDRYSIGTYDDMTAFFGGTISFTEGTPDGSAIQLTGYQGSNMLVFAPTAYYIEMPVEPQVSGLVADMVNLVPLLLIVGLVVAVVGMFVYWRADRGGGDSEDLNPYASGGFQGSAEVMG